MSDAASSSRSVSSRHSRSRHEVRGASTARGAGRDLVHPARAPPTSERSRRTSLSAARSAMRRPPQRRGHPPLDAGRAPRRGRGGSTTSSGSRSSARAQRRVGLRREPGLAAPRARARVGARTAARTTSARAPRRVGRAVLGLRVGRRAHERGRGVVAHPAPPLRTKPQPLARRLVLRGRGASARSQSASRGPRRARSCRPTPRAVRRSAASAVASRPTRDGVLGRGVGGGARGRGDRSRGRRGAPATSDAPRAQARNGRLPVQRPRPVTRPARRPGARRAAARARARRRARSRASTASSAVRAAGTRVSKRRSGSSFQVKSPTTGMPALEREGDLGERAELAADRDHRLAARRRRSCCARPAGPSGSRRPRTGWRPRARSRAGSRAVSPPASCAPMQAASITPRSPPQATTMPRWARRRPTSWARLNSRRVQVPAPTTEKTRRTPASSRGRAGGATGSGGAPARRSGTLSPCAPALLALSRRPRPPRRAAGTTGRSPRTARPAAPARKKRPRSLRPRGARDPSPLDRAGLASWARTRPGDTATWEIRVKGSPTVTRLTWKAVEIQDGIVRFEVDSTTDGRRRAAPSPRPRAATSATPSASIPSSPRASRSRSSSARSGASASARSARPARGSTA